MTRSALAFTCAVLLLAGCGDDLAPEYTRPLAEWRQAGVPARALPTVGGPTLQVPNTRDGLCIGPEPGNSYAGCVFRLDEATGRLATGQTGYDQRLEVEMIFERDGFAHVRGEARIGADQRAAGDPPEGEAAVEQVLSGVSAGQTFVVGCWHRLAVNASGSGLNTNGPYACTLVVQNRSLGATVVDYPAPTPTRPNAPLDQARLDRIVAVLAAIEASFLPQTGRG